MLEVTTLLFLLVLVYGVGHIFRRLGLPPMVGEVLAGLVFGPGILNIINETDSITMLAELGIFFLMFYSGLETDPKKLSQVKIPSMIIGFCGVVFPFAFGYFVSSFFGMTFYQSLFIGMGLSITAIAVNARIINDLNISKTRAGRIIMGAAIVDDVIAFMLFSVLLEIIKTDTVALKSIVLIIAKVAVFFFITMYVGYKILFPLISRRFLTTELGSFTFALIMALFFGWLAESTGMHLILGAYLAGLFVREEVMDEKIYRSLENRFGAISYGFLAPIFFVTLGFHVDFSIVFSDFWLLATILIAATAGKMLGAVIGSVISGLGMPDSIIIGFAMNGRGAVELVLASIGLSLGVINSSIFSILVFVAFVTTLIAPLSMKWYISYVGKKIHAQASGASSAASSY